MSMATWVWFERPERDGGRPVSRAEALRGFTEQLAELAAADASITGGTLVLAGERIVLDLGTSGGRA